MCYLLTWFRNFRLSINVNIHRPSNVPVTDIIAKRVHLYESGPRGTQLNVFLCGNKRLQELHPVHITRLTTDRVSFTDNDLSVIENTPPVHCCVGTSLLFRGCWRAVQVACPKRAWYRYGEPPLGAKTLRRMAFVLGNRSVLPLGVLAMVGTFLDTPSSIFIGQPARILK